MIRTTANEEMGSVTMMGVTVLDGNKGSLYGMTYMAVVGSSDSTNAWSTPPKALTSASSGWLSCETSSSELFWGG